MNFRLLIIVAVCLWVVDAHGDAKKTRDNHESDSVPISSAKMSLANVPGLVRENHADLKAARWWVEEARGRLVDAGKWQNPKLISDYISDPSSREINGSVGFSQAFPVAGRLRWEKAVNQALLTAAETEVADVERRLISQAKELAVRVFAITEHKALQTRQLGLAQELTATVERLVERGEGSVLDLGHSRLAETELELEVHHLDHEADRLLGQLRIRLGLPPECQLKLEGGLPAPAEAKLQTIATSQRPDYRALSELAEAARREIGLARANRWQDVTLGLYGRLMREEDRPIGLENEQRIGVQLSVPLPVWRDNRGAIQEKKAKAARLDQSLIALTNEIRNDIAASRTVMNTLATHAHEVRNELLPEARRHVEQILAAYQAGQTDARSVIESRSQEIAIEVKYLQSIEDYHLARVRYETAIGNFELGGDE